MVPLWCVALAFLAPAPRLVACWHAAAPIARSSRSSRAVMEAVERPEAFVGSTFGSTSGEVSWGCNPLVRFADGSVLLLELC